MHRRVNGGSARARAVEKSLENNPLKLRSLAGCRRVFSRSWTRGGPCPVCVNSEHSGASVLMGDLLPSRHDGSMGRLSSYFEDRCQWPHNLRAGPLGPCSAQSPVVAETQGPMGLSGALSGTQRPYQVNW